MDLDAFVCPRRREDGTDGEQFRLDRHDQWTRRGDRYACNYCGSMHPEEFLQAAREGVELGPTDKNYTVYVGPSSRKFYFQHFSRAERLEFLQLLNRGALNLSYPGHFYVLPFFIKAIK